MSSQPGHKPKVPNPSRMEFEWPYNPWIQKWPLCAGAAVPQAPGHGAQGESAQAQRGAGGGVWGHQVHPGDEDHRGELALPHTTRWGRDNITKVYKYQIFILGNISSWNNVGLDEVNKFEKWLQSNNYDVTLTRWRGLFSPLSDKTSLCAQQINNLSYIHAYIIIPAEKFKKNFLQGLSTQDLD